MTNKMKEYTLVGVNGNAFSIMGYVTKAMKAEGYTTEEVSRYYDEATKSNYDRLVSVSIEKIDEINSRKAGK